MKITIEIPDDVAEDFLQFHHYESLIESEDKKSGHTKIVDNPKSKENFILDSIIRWIAGCAHQQGIRVQRDKINKSNVNALDVLLKHNKRG